MSQSFRVGINIVLERLKLFSEIEPTPTITELLIKALAQLLVVLSVTAKQINQTRLRGSWCSF